MDSLIRRSHCRALRGRGPRARLGVACAASACIAMLTACANPLRQDVAPETALLPTRTVSPAQSSTAQTQPPPASTATSEPDSVGTETTRGPVADTVYPACRDQRPTLAVRAIALPDAAGQIAYLTPNGNVALTDPNGRARIEVTSDAFVSEDGQAGRVYQFPTFSADGAHIAFTSLSSSPGFDGITSTVHVAPAAAGATVSDLYASAEWNIPYLDWSPDSRTIAFLTIGPADGAIRAIDRAGGDAAIFDSGVPTYWHWRNDSGAMVTHLGGRAAAPGGANISVIETKAAAKGEQAVLDALPGNFQSPHYAPDGQTMLYVANTGQSDELVLADREGTASCTLTAVTSSAYFAFSPDGGKVAVMDTATPVTEPAPLVVHDLASGEDRVVHERASAFFWSPNGEHLAVYSVVPDATITPLAASPAKRNAPRTQSRDAALRIEIVAAATGTSVRVADTYPSRQFVQYLQFFDQYSRAVSPWSPDGKHLVFSSFFPERGSADVAVATLNDARSAVDVRRIAAGTVAFWSPR